MNKILRNFIFLFSFITISCSKDDSPSSSSKSIKYELSGTYSGTLIVVYTNPDGINQIEDNISLPWLKEITLTNPSATTAIVLTAGSEVSGAGQANEIVTGKIFIGSYLKKTATVNTTSIGYASLDIATLYE
ncbi:hypothetical protein GOQ30_13040 [Flavobacterium sp. TP390]|uniref:Uncharacterized protein n=1 Tax=Flavobacterium profundi TaxID=1774945 RepID=A0A6I4IT98_9FLAO|nr:MmpS family transport accessory protein [Flavobacterium profundi]MVO10091.1 hypothetical protein [Flavobacterium profundi]